MILLTSQWLLAQSIDIYPNLRKVFFEQGKVLPKNEFFYNDLNEFYRSNTYPTFRSFYGSFEDRSSYHSLILTIHTDFEMPYVYIYDEAGNDTMLFPLDTMVSVMLPEGIYGIITGFFPNSLEEILIV